jgi:hypothetical protein
MLLDLAFLASLAVVSLGVGLRMLRALELTPDAAALAIPLGLGFLALAVLGLAEAGILNAKSIAGVLATGAVVGGRSGVVMMIAIARRWPRPWKYPDSIIDGALMIGLVGTLLTALGPVTDGDALCYHLQVPRIFLDAGSAVFEPDLHETIYPLATESLYALALALRGPVACRLVQWWLGVTLFASVTALARPFLGDRARWAGALVLLVPAVSNGMGAPLNDVALAAFGNAAILAWTRWRDHPSRRSAALAGTLAGLAIGVKYPALVLTGLLGLGFLVPGKLPLRIRLMHGLWFVTMAFLIGGGWYLRAWIFTGNPVYPFFRHLFGGAGIDEVLDPIKRPMAVTVGNLLTALGPMTLEPARFDSLAHQFGPAFLLFLPPLLWERPPRRLLGIVAIGYLFLLICLTQRQSMRFVLIALGPLAVGVAWLLNRWSERQSWPARGLVALAALMLVAEAGLALGRTRPALGVILGRESSESYLARREPTFVVGQWMEKHLPREARVIGQDHRGFYLPRAYTMELAHRRRTGLGKHAETADEIVATLRSERFTHLMLCPPTPRDAVEFDPTLGDRLAPWLATHPPLYRRDLADADGVTRTYAIHDLTAPARATLEARR